MDTGEMHFLIGDSGTKIDEGEKEECKSFNIT